MRSSSSSALSIALTDVHSPATAAGHHLVRSMVAAIAESHPGAAPPVVGQRLGDVATAELVLFYAFGKRHLLARGTTVAISEEPRFSATALADWTIDWRHRPVATHFRLPIWASAAMPWGNPIALEAAETGNDHAQRRFCNFIYANAHSPMRNGFFEALNQRERVDALGAVHRNATHPLLTDRSDPQWFASKIPVLRNYRFTIAFENEEHPGYTTEKILHAWAADSVPIYWGNPLLTVDFPPDSYLSLHEAGSVSRLVEQVLEAHRDPARYDELRRANPIRTGRLDELVNGFREGLAPFLRAIVDDAARFQGRSRRHPTRRALNAARFGRWWARDELSKRIG